MRVVWVVVVLGAGWVLVQGMVLTTYFELTPEAAADAERGHRALWAATVVLWAAAGFAGWRWQAGPWSLAALAAAGPAALLLESWGWIPLVAVLVAGPLLLGGLAGLLLAPRRAPCQPAQQARND